VEIITEKKIEETILLYIWLVILALAEKKNDKPNQL